jgi:hypothetical protein
MRKDKDTNNERNISTDAVSNISQTVDHISNPLGIEPGSLMTRSKQVELCVNAVRLQGLHRAPSPPPPTADYVRCEAGRRSDRVTRTEELCEIKWDYHIVGTMA